MKDWNEIFNLYNKYEKMPYRPDTDLFPKLQDDFITDENKSVKWNREQVEISKPNYEKEAARLKALKSKAGQEVYEYIYETIQNDIGNNFSKENAIKVWNYAYEQGHSDGFYDILDKLYDVMNLVRDILD